MRNATLSALWLLLGTGIVASTAAAQTDETEDSAAQGEGTPGAAEGDVDAPAVEEAAPDELREPSDADPEPEVSTPAEAAASALDAPSSSGLEEGDVEEAEAGAEGGAQEEQEEEAAAPPELPWRNTFFSWTHAATFNSFVRPAQLSYNPYYAQTVSLTPRWYLGPQSFFLLSQSLGVEAVITDRPDYILGLLDAQAR